MSLVSGARLPVNALTFLAEARTTPRSRDVCELLWWVLTATCVRREILVFDFPNSGQRECSVTVRRYHIGKAVYDAVDGDVGKELRKKNPDPHFLHNHHQWLKKFGRDKVHDQITTVVTIMKLCENMDDFRQKFGRLFKKSSPQMEFTFAPSLLSRSEQRLG